MGGTCTNDGCVPTRVLAKAARLLRDAEQFEEYGLIGGIPDLDFQQLLSRTQHVVYKMHEKKQFLHHLRSSDVTVFAEVGAVHFVDPHTIALADGQQLQAEKFILCLGGRSAAWIFRGRTRPDPSSCDAIKTPAALNDHCREQPRQAAS
jgi:pyruvate/2-oxoglutarate dehydrogenase complex dihydrolipoamide dehydrogenase (E3) component